MSKIALKICGIRRAEIFGALTRPPVEYLGFVFHPPSSRYVSPDRAAELARTAPANIRKVGVFVDATDELIAAALPSIDMLQLHGSESPREVMRLRRKFAMATIKALQINAESDLAAITAYENIADFIMLDAGGGSGRTFDWNLCRGRKMPNNWFLAGGINAYNIPVALKTGAGVLDVSGGVESAPGRKSEAKIRELIGIVNAES